MTKPHLATFLATIGLILATATAENSTAQSDYRLPKDVTPYQYDINLTIDPEADGFNGTVVIYFADNNITANITHFHINADPQYVNISSIIVNGKISCTFMANATTSLVHITCPQGFSNDSNYATVVFSSKYNTESCGMYKDSYLDLDGNKTWFVATQFEPQRARMAIPCLDEPSYKAVFNLVVTTPSGYRVLSNAAIVDFDAPTRDNNINTYYFGPTPKMSTYLLAISVSKFESVDVDDNFKIFARPEVLQYTTRALHYGQSVLTMLGGWLGIPYATLGISKSYQIAEPHKSGAMENWGLVTYGEYAILDTGESTSEKQKQSIFTVMCHELSHQWFGDYVTASWWSEIWLNEGFATYFQYFLADEIDSSFELSQTYVVEVLHSVLEDDSDPTSLPVVSNEDDIYTSADASRKFDSISYQKGSAILTFIAYFVGEANFRQGLINYLNTWQLSNSNTDSFLSIMSTTSNMTNLPSYLHNWLYEPGYPVVNVSLSEDGTKLSFTQQRFFGPGITADSTTQWYVPISYTFSNESNFAINNIKTWLEPNKKLEIDYVDEYGWVVVNLQELGFYRVNYDQALWKKLAAALKQNASQIHVTNRAQIINDVFSLAKSDFVDFSVAFDLVTFLKNDSSYHSWYAGAKQMTSLMGVGDDEDDSNLKSLILSLVQDHVLIPDDSTNATAYSSMQILNQTLLLRTACDAGHSGCIAYAQEQFGKFKNGSSLDPNFKETIICTAIQHSDTAHEDYEFVYRLIRNSNSEVEKNTLALGLTCIFDLTVLEEYLNDIISDNSTIDNTEAQKIFTYLYSNNPKSVDVTLGFLVNQTSEIVKHFNGTSQLTALITGLSSKLTTDDQIQKLQELKNNTTTQAVVDTIQKALDKATSNKNWLDSHKTALKAALKANNGKNSASSIANLMFLTVLTYLAVKLV